MSNKRYPESSQKCWRPSGYSIFLRKPTKSAVQFPLRSQFPAIWLCSQPRNNSSSHRDIPSQPKRRTASVNWRGREKALDAMRIAHPLSILSAFMVSMRRTTGVDALPKLSISISRVTETRDLQNLWAAQFFFFPFSTLGHAGRINLAENHYIVWQPRVPDFHPPFILKVNPPWNSVIRNTGNGVFKMQPQICLQRTVCNVLFWFIVGTSKALE